MFSDELLEKILTDEEMRKIPVGAQSTAIRAIERVLEEEERSGRNDATVRKS